MRILVTGHDGQVARSLAERAAGHELIRVPSTQLDLADPASIARAVATVAPELIVNAGAYTAVDRAEGDATGAMAINGTGPGVLAAAAARIGAPVIQLSTDYVFDGTLDRSYREDDPVAPLGVYGQTKLAGEQTVAASGAAYAILRTAWVYSPFGANFVKTMLRLAADREEVAVVADQIGNPTSALDIADAVLAIAAAWQRAPGHGQGAVYHLAGDGAASWADFAREIFAVSGRHGGPSATVRDIGTADYPTPARRPANSRLDSGRFTATFGYRAPPWRKSLAPVVARLIGRPA